MELSHEHEKDTLMEAYAARDQALTTLREIESGIPGNPEGDVRVKVERVHCEGVQGYMERRVGLGALIQGCFNRYVRGKNITL